INDGSFQFTKWKTLPVGDHPVFVLLSDLNGDGRADLSTVNAYESGGGGGVTVRLQPAGSNWNPAAPAQEIATPAFGTMLSAGDVNADGKKDLVVSFASGPVDRILAVSPGQF